MTTLTHTLPQFLQSAWLRPPLWVRRATPSRLEKQVRFEKRCRRALERQSRLVLGTLERPWDPLTELSFPTLYELLHDRGSIVVEIVCRSPRLLHDAPLLAELDQCHALRVDVPLAASRDSCGLAMVRALGERGVLARLVLTAWEGEEEARRLMGAARAARAADVVLAAPRATVETRRAFARLRLEQGFPRALPGRG